MLGGEAATGVTLSQVVRIARTTREVCVGQGGVRRVGGEEESGSLSLADFFAVEHGLIQGSALRVSWTRDKRLSLAS